ncbi:MAG TPA: hypothetical protein VIZ22_09370 [Candidatus Limnocylindrales bacterium]
MSAFDTMPTDDLERRLSSWMGGQGPDTDLTSTYDTIIDATRGARQRPWFLVRRGIRRTTPMSERRFATERALTAGLAVLLVVLAIGAGLVIGGRLLTSPDESTPAPSESSSAPTSVDALAIENGISLSPGQLATSRLFQPTLTFRPSPRTPGESAVDLCPSVESSSRSLVLAHPKGCVEDLRFIRPWAVDCGSAGEHPDADALATAILAIPSTSGSTDLGDLQSAGAVPPAMFADQYHGRVVEMLGYNPLFQADVVNRDDCRLLPEPGSGDPVIEIRRDLSALFVLIDVNGELIVIRASVAGHDAASGGEAQSRGYGQGGSEQLRHLLGLVYDVRFGP